MKTVTPPAVLVLAEALDNVGDLALLCQLAEGLRSRCGLNDITVRVWQHPSPETADWLFRHGIDIQPARSLSGLFPRQRLLLYGGGQVVRGNVSPASMLVLVATLLAASARQTSCVALAIGASKLPQGWPTWLWRLALSRFKLIAARDSISQSILNSLCGSSMPIALTADLAFLPSPLHTRLQLPSKPRHLVIAPCCDASEGRSLDPLKLVPFVRAFAPNITHIVIVCHDARPGMDGIIARDIRAAFSTIQGLHVDLVETTDLAHVTEIYRDAHAVITNRLHALIFALLARKPAIIIDDGNPKLAAAAARFHVPLWQENRTVKEPDEHALSWEWTERGGLIREQALAQAGADAERNFSLLATVLRLKLSSELDNAANEHATRT